VYLKCIIRNYWTAGKRGLWPASEDISLPYLTSTRAEKRSIRPPLVIIDYRIV